MSFGDGVEPEAAVWLGEEASAMADAVRAEGIKTWAGCEAALGTPNGLGGTRGSAAAAGLGLQPGIKVFSA